MKNTQSEAQTEKEHKQIAKRRKSAARQIARSGRGGIVLLAAIVIFIVGFGIAFSTINSEWEKAYGQVIDTPAADLVSEIAGYKALLALIVWLLITTALLEGYVYWKSTNYLTLPKAELRKRWLELGGFEEPKN